MLLLQQKISEKSNKILTFLESLDGNKRLVWEKHKILLKPFSFKEQILKLSVKGQQTLFPPENSEDSF